MIEPEAAGTLFALTELGRLDFALDLLRELWAQGDVLPGSALWVIERGLDSSDEEVQAEAVGSSATTPQA